MLPEGQHVIAALQGIANETTGRIPFQLSRRATPQASCTSSPKGEGAVSREAFGPAPILVNYPGLL